MPNPLQKIGLPLKLKKDYGKRPDASRKDEGFLGELKLPDGGVATEYSMQSGAVKLNGKQVDFPTLVPTLSKDEIELMRNDIIPNTKPIPEPIIQKAIKHANLRLAQKLSPFYKKEIDESTAKDIATKDIAKKITPVKKLVGPEIQKWRESTFKPGDPYRENDQAFRNTVIARILTGDSGSDGDNPMPMEPETLEISSAYGKMLDERGNLEKKQEFNRMFRKPILGQNRGIMRSSARQIK